MPLSVAAPSPSPPPMRSGGEAIVRRLAAHCERQPYCRGVHYELPYSIRQALVALAILGAGRVLYAWICWLTEC
jgi:hypothetical protein